MSCQACSSWFPIKSLYARAHWQKSQNWCILIECMNLLGPHYGLCMSSIITRTLSYPTLFGKVGLLSLGLHALHRPMSFLRKYIQAYIYEQYPCDLSNDVLMKSTDYTMIEILGTQFKLYQLFHHHLL